MKRRDLRVGVHGLDTHRQESKVTSEVSRARRREFVSKVLYNAICNTGTC